MNIKYIEKRRLLKVQGEWQEELEAQDYKASLKQQVVTQLNSGTTVFSKPLFLADYYTIESRKPWTKDRVDRKMSELAVFDGKSMTPEEFYKTFRADFMQESNRAIMLLENEIDNNMPLKSLYKDDESYEEAITIFNMRKSGKLQKERDDLTVIKSFIASFVPGMAVIYNGIYGKFLGYKILDTGTKFKYTKGNIEFQFCFLARYPILHMKLSSSMNELNEIKAALTYQSMLYNLDEVRKKVQLWKPDLNKRIIRRFLTGNILSGVVEAQKKKLTGEIRDWTLQRFTNIDGSYTTAIELKYEVDLPDNASIFTRTTTLSVACNNANIVDYILQLPVSIGDDFNMSGGFVTSQNIYPIWNVESDKLVDRGIAIVHRQTTNINILEFQIVQSYKKSVDQTTKRKFLKARKEGEVLYNVLFHDDAFHQKFKRFFLGETQKPVPYAFKMKTKDGDKPQYYDWTADIKTYQYDLKDTSNIMGFLSELHKKYDVSFNFRSDVASYYNVASQKDVPLEVLKKEQQIQEFPDGEYEYRFSKQPNATIFESIPDIIRKTTNGAFGGVILKKPILPNLLPSYDLKPYNLPNDILVKLTTAVLKDDDKIEFTKGLLDLRDSDDFTVGNFVRQLVTEKSVGPIYFFGNLSIPDYGEIFKQFALNKDVNQLIVKPVDEEEKIGIAPKSQITFDDAESFVLKLWSLI
jgi:hypothetical protein